MYHILEAEGRQETEAVAVARQFDVVGAVAGGVVVGLVVVVRPVNHQIADRKIVRGEVVRHGPMCG